MNRRHFALAALMLALLSPAARADLGEMKQDIKQGSKMPRKKRDTPRGNSATRPPTQPGRSVMA